MCVLSLKARKFEVVCACWLGEAFAGANFEKVVFFPCNSTWRHAFIMSRYIAKEGGSRLSEKVSNILLLVLSTGAVGVLGLHLYLRHIGAVPCTSPES